jgi:hypothetical protein
MHQVPLAHIRSKTLAQSDLAIMFGAAALADARSLEGEANDCTQTDAMLIRSAS